MLSYNEAKKLMESAKSKANGKPLASNTRLYQNDDGSYGIVYHRTEIVRIHADGTYTLNNGGWYTVTTKQRLNEYAPVSIFQRKHVWYLASGANGKPMQYVNGMRVAA